MDSDKIKVLFVVNKKAGHSPKPMLYQMISSHSEKFNYQSEYYEMNSNDHKISLNNIINQYQPNIVAAVGGDGTVNLVSSVIYQKDISLLIIPIGSANGMAKELQIPDQLESCLDLIIKGNTVEVDLLKVNDEISMHLADVGLNARIVKRFQLDTKRGLLTYGKHLFYEIFLIRKKRFIIYYDKKVKKVSAISLTFANANKYGSGAVINPDGLLNDGLFEICIVKPFPKWKVFTIAFQMFRNTLKTSKYFEIIQCQNATVTCKRKTLLQVDGEIIGKVNMIKLTCLPKVLKVIIPAGLRHPTIID